MRTTNETSREPGESGSSVVLRVLAGLAVAAAVALGAAGCSDDGEETATQSGEPTASSPADAEAESDQTDDAATTEEASASGDESASEDEGEQPAEPSESVAGPALLDDVIGAEPSGEAWRLPVGTYVTSVLGPPISLTINEELSAIDVVPGLIGLGGPDFSFAEFNSVVITTPEGGLAFSGDSTEPEPVEIADVGAYLEGQDRIVILGSGTSSDGLPYWDISSNVESEGSFECPFGSACVPLMNVPTIGTIVIGEVFSFRLYELPSPPTGELVLGFVQANTDVFDEWTARGEALMASLTYNAELPADEGPTDDGPIKVAQAAGGPLAAGDYTTIVGAADVSFALPEDVEGAVFESFVSPDAMLVTYGATPAERPPGFFAISTLLGFLTEDSAKSLPVGPPAENQLVGPDVAIDDHLRSLGAVTVTDSGEVVFGEASATWWQLELDEDAADDSNSFDCDGVFGAPGDRCVEILGTPTFGIILDPTLTTRVYLLEGNEHVVVVEGADDTFDEWAAELEPLLDSLEIG